MHAFALRLSAFFLFGALTAQTAAAASAAQQPAVTPAQDRAIQASARKELRAFGGKQPVPGVYIAVYAPGKSPYVRGVGVANLKTKAPFELHDRFRIGSNTKTFIVTIILQLQDEHKLRVDDPVGKFDIGVKIPNGNHISLRQLAEMRSGLFEAYNTKQFNAQHFSPALKLSANQMIGWAVSNKPLFPPGQRWNYCNTNYLILGRVIEVLTHDSIENQVRKRILGPMGLRSTYFPDTVTMPTPYAHGYGLNSKGTWDDVSETIGPSITWAAGAMISTVPDMARWVKMYVTGTPTSAASQRDRMRCIPITPGSPMGFGMGIGCSSGWYGYTGGLPGYNTAAYYLPSRGITLIAFVTAQKETPFPGVANDIARDITKIITPNAIVFKGAPAQKPH